MFDRFPHVALHAITGRVNVSSFPPIQEWYPNGLSHIHVTHILRY